MAVPASGSSARHRPCACPTAASGCCSRRAPSDRAATAGARDGCRLMGQRGADRSGGHSRARTYKPSKKSDHDTDLYRKTGPLERMGDDQVIQIGAVLLPNLVLLVDQRLLQLWAQRRDKDEFQLYFHRGVGLFRKGHDVRPCQAQLPPKGGRTRTPSRCTQEAVYLPRSPRYHRHRASYRRFRGTSKLQRKMRSSKIDVVLNAAGDLPVYRGYEGCIERDNKHTIKLETLSLWSYAPLGLVDVQCALHGMGTTDARRIQG